MGLISAQKAWAKLDPISIAGDVLADMDDFIEVLNRKQMADKGVRADGTAIEPEYTFNTKDAKSRKSGIASIIEHVTLFGDGPFHNSISSNIINDNVILDASDSKTNELISKYGEVLGLTDESINILRAAFWPKYIARIKKELKKN